MSLRQLSTKGMARVRIDARDNAYLSMSTPKTLALQLQEKITLLGLLQWRMDAISHGKVR